MLERVRRAILRMPSARDAADLFWALVVFAAIGAAVSLGAGLASWSPREPGQIAFLAVRAFFIPAFGEEMVFRAALVPTRGESARPVAWIAISTSLFTLWHVAETAFLAGSADTFRRPDFLALATLLGLLCAVLRYRSGTVWTAIVLHWLVVVAWQGWFGGPSFGGFA